MRGFIHAGDRSSGINSDHGRCWHAACGNEGLGMQACRGCSERIRKRCQMAQRRSPWLGQQDVERNDTTISLQLTRGSVARSVGRIGTSDHASFSAAIDTLPMQARLLSSRFASRNRWRQFRCGGSRSALSNQSRHSSQQEPAGPGFNSLSSIRELAEYRSLPHVQLQKGMSILVNLAHAASVLGKLIRIHLISAERPSFIMNSPRTEYSYRESALSAK